MARAADLNGLQNYIQRDELQTKLRLCQHLGLVPLFIMRSAPKSYMYDIAVKNKGFGLLFEEQIYPWGHSTLLAEVRHQLGLKVQSPRDIKEGDMQRLVNWHLKMAPKT